MKRNGMKSVFAALAVVMMTSLCLGVTTTRVMAEENPLNELEGSTSSALKFGTNRTTSFQIAVGYSRTFMDMLQGTFRGEFLTAGGFSDLVLEIGPTFDLAIDNTGIRNAIFLRAVGGLAYTNVGSGTSAFAYNVAIGKRVELCKVISWDPEFSVSGTTIKGTDPVFSLTPIALSFLF